MEVGENDRHGWDCNTNGLIEEQTLVWIESNVASCKGPRTVADVKMPGLLRRHLGINPPPLVARSSASHSFSNALSLRFPYIRYRVRTQWSKVWD